MTDNLWEAHAASTAAGLDRVAVIDQQGSSLTHRELSLAAAQASAGLAAHGVGRGDVIGAFLPNRTNWMVLAFAAAHRGCGILGLNTRFREAELNHLVGVGAVDVVVVPSDNFLGLDATELFSGLDRALTLIDDLPAAPDARSESRASGTRTDPLMGFTTSGTTGFPKVAMHSNHSTMRHLAAVAKTFGFDAETVALVPLPMCGAFGYSLAMAVIVAGGKVVLHETWDPSAATTAMAEHGVTYFAGGDLMLIDVANTDEFEQVTTWTGGTFADFANAGRDAVETCAQRSAGRVRLGGVYGSSEGFALMSQWSADASIDERVQAGGYLVSPDMAVRACDPETEQRLAHHEPGELQFRGPNLIDEYLNNPAATAKAFGADGWYRSGDLGYTIEPLVTPEGDREGFVFLARLGDSLRLRGFLCDPSEIEHHLESHPAVALAQVVGAHRDGEGDVAVAFVQLHPDASVEADDLHRHCSSGLANYKRPAHIELVPGFPVTEGPNGTKIRKIELRQRARTLITLSEDC